MKETFLFIIRTARKSTMSLPVMQIKLGEEFGELSEAVNHQLGHLQHKTMKEPLAGEVADVINTAIGVLVRAYPDHSDEQLADMLNAQLHLKTAKWERVQETVK